MRARAAILLAAACLAALAATPAGACACGVAPQARIDVERALVVHRGNREDLVISYDLRAAGSRPAVVLPVPGEPEVSAVEGDPFGWLERATAQPVAASGGGDDEGAGAGAPRTIKRSTIGGYSVTRLHGGSGAALDRWLRRNGYALPAGAEPILDDYAEDDWWFVALRLDSRADGALKPLRLGFASDRPVYPMRLAQLGTQPVNLDLYAVTDGAVAASPLRQVSSQTIGDVDEPSLRDLLPRGAVLTKLQAVHVGATLFREDIVLRDDADVWRRLVVAVARLA